MEHNVFYLEKVFLVTAFAAVVELDIFDFELNLRSSDVR